MRLGKRLRNSASKCGLGMAVSYCDADGVTICQQRLAAGTIVWGAGVKAPAAAQWLDTDKDRVGRVVVGEDLSLAELSEIF